MAKSDMTAQKWKDKGDEEFNKGNWSEALIHYTGAINLVTEDNTEKASYYDKRAATYFELRDYDKTIEDCNSVKKIYYKLFSISMFRRFLALIELERFEEARQDMKMILCYSDNTMSQSLPTQFHEISHKIKEKVSQMMGLAFNVSVDKEKRENAMINLLRLASWSPDAYEIFVKEVGENDEAICSAIRIVDELCKNNISHTELTMINVVLPWCLEMMNSKSTERVNASQYCLQNILNKYSGMNNEPSSKPDVDLCEEHKEEIDNILSCLLDKIGNKTTTGIARDAIIELITRNIHYTALDWAKRLVEFDGLKKLMEIASQLEEYQYESSLDITSSTQTVTSVCLAKICENLYNDDAKEFFNIINEFIGDELDLTTVTSNVRAVVAMTTLTLGPFKVADVIITEDGFDEMIVGFSEKNDILLQNLICEFIYVVVTKYDEFKTFIGRSLTILEDLYYSKDLDDTIRVRAFVVICKMNKFKESIRRYRTVHTFDEEQIGTWLEVCRRFLINPQRDMRKWAVEGLSYLTFNIGVKKKLIEDREAIQAIIAFAKTENQSVLYRVDILLLNLCHAYDNKDVLIPEILMFLEYFHLENHILIEDRDVEERRRVLAHAGVTSALVSLVKTDSQNSKELIAHVFNAICSQEELRKIVVDEGGTEALLSLALSGTDKGKKIASQVLVHLALTIPPEVAFPGQMIMQVVRPIFNLLKRKYDALAINILSVLCNLASVNDSMRQHIFNEAGYERLSRILIYSHKTASQRYWGRLRAAELLDNLALNREVAIKFYEHAKAKEVMKSMLDILCFYGDRNKALAGAGVRLTAVDNEYCEKMLDRIYSSDENAIPLQVLLYNSDSDLQYRGIKTVLNMMKSTRKVATKLMETDIIMEQLRELSKNDAVQNKEIKELASLALEVGAEWGKLKRNVEQNGSSQSTDNIEHSIKKAKCED
ncbi:protein unc-45 homolog B-like [Temnothorax nylanderi]|uniref:protein unc-45 homolog B-like n=1 Tax=Temnothorax nylanderi TaxID=102681 RepID=UPI003A839B7A